MTINLKDFHAVITGASAGLGKSMARALLKHGAAVALAARPGERLEKAVLDFQKEGLNASALPMDVRSEESIEQAVSWVKEHWGRIDMLVNNAGLLMQRSNPEFRTNPKPFFKIDAESFRDVIETNITGYFLVAKAFVPMMISRGKGRIVNISTSLSTMTRKNFTPYGPSRAGSEALSNVMTADLEEYGITVNALLPGGPVAREELTEDRNMFSDSPMRLLEFDVMEEPILFLSSPLAEGITGERIIAKEFKDWLKAKEISEWRSLKG